MSYFTMFSTWVNILNIILVIALLVVYIRNFAKIRSGFTLGLIIFAGVFLIQNIALLYFTMHVIPVMDKAADSFTMVFSLLQTAAFAVLNYITWR